MPQVKNKRLGQTGQRIEEHREKIEVFQFILRFWEMARKVGLNNFS